MKKSNNKISIPTSKEIKKISPDFGFDGEMAVTEVDPSDSPKMDMKKVMEAFEKLKNREEPVIPASGLKIIEARDKLHCCICAKWNNETIKYFIRSQKSKGAPYRTQPFLMICEDHIKELKSIAGARNLANVHI